MFYVCVVCMVSVKGKRLIKLTGARCELWQLIISPRINIEKIQKCLLLVCPECNQLLATMLEFRRTMYVGARNLLFLYKNLKSKNLIKSLEQESPPCHELHELPAVIGAQSDELLPVANEEVVQSDISWNDVRAPPVASKIKHVKLMPPALPARIINRGAVHVSEHIEDYAVLTPINEDTNLQCKEDVVPSSELSGTSNIEELVEKIQAEFSSVSDSSKVNKIKLNRQLFEAIRVTLKSPSLTEEFDFKYGPESEPESGCKSGPELAREWALELARESALKLELESERKPECESALDSERKSELESNRKSELESNRKSECDSALESERKSERESESNSARELALESEPDSESTLSCESDYEDPEHFPNIIFAKAFNRLVGEEPQMQGKDLEQGDNAEEHIHCHLVTNPPSEWPCTGEQCGLHSAEREAPATPSDSPRHTPVVRSETKNDVPGRPKCKLCARSFTKISMLWHHFERAHMDASLKCNVCRKEFRNETELTFHKMKHQFKKTVEYQFETPSRHACLECAVRCRGAQTLRAHLATRTHAAKMQWRFQCEICKRKCPDRKQMAEHIQREHLAKEAVKCSMCSASFRSARTLRGHVAKHMVEQTQRNKPTDTQTNGQARKRARDTLTKGENTDSDILRNRETHTEMQTNEQARKGPHHVSKTSTAGHRPPPKSATMAGSAPASSDLPRPLPGHQSAWTKTKRPRKTANNETHANRRRNTHADTNIKEQDDMEIQTNGQTRKKPRKIIHKKVNAYANSQGNTHTDTYLNEQDDIDIQTNKKPRKVTHNKVKKYANRLTNEHIDTYINEQDDIEKQPNGQTRKKPGKASRNSQANTFTNKQENIATDTYVYGQENTHKETHSKNSKITHADGRKTRTDKEIIPTAADTTHSDTNGRARKRRKRRAYLTSKRARAQPKAKASLFDMLSSFIL